MQSRSQQPGHGGLGTFLGVFTPTVLTILGVIMYLRFGWVVGNAGLGATLLIVGLSCLITLVTALSISAMATNMRVGVGGAYYIISRSLGLEIGGAIGLPLFLSQAVSLTLYCYGLAESLRLVWPGAPVSLIAGALVVLVSAVAARSTVWALRMQVPILLLVGLSIASLFAGASSDAAETVVAIGGFEDAGFWEIFAVFFPAVTGILAGVSLSGDLRDPDRSLPLGTLLGVATGTVIYFTIPFALAYSVAPEVLRAEPLVWLQVAAVPALVLPGLWGAILSSAIGSILAAPRTLQALADDNLVSRRLAETHGEEGTPRTALGLSAGVALAAVFLGDLNSVAVVVSMFFLTTYASMNIVCGLEGLIRDPSFRPRFNVHWAVPLSGALACVWVMLLINTSAAVVALLVVVGLWFYLSRRTLEATWGDMRGGVLMSLAVWALVRKRRQMEHRRSWRPHILVFTSDVSRNLPLVRLAWAFSLERGVLTVASLLEGDVDTVTPADELAGNNVEFLAARGVTAFCEVDVVPDLESGMVTVAQANGIAGLASNTIMLGWPDREGFLVPAMRVMRRLDRLGKSLIIVRQRDVVMPRKRKIIIWWSGKEDNGDLMLLLAHLLRQNADWRRSELVLKTIVDDRAQGPSQLERLQAMVEETRIHARSEIIVRFEGRPVPELIREHSIDATLVILGMALPEVGQEEAHAAHIQALVEQLPPVILVRNSGPFRGELV